MFTLTTDNNIERYYMEAAISMLAVRLVVEESDELPVEKHLSSKMHRGHSLIDFPTVGKGEFQDHGRCMLVQKISIRSKNDNKFVI